jgi:hypothetical protein
MPRPSGLWWQALVLGIAVALAGCRSTASAGRATRRLLEDPCILVGRTDAEAILGPLASNPFRADARRAPDPAGPSCLYRAANGQSISLTPTYGGGALALQSLGDTVEPRPGAVRSLWLPPGRLVALVDDVLLDVDVVNSTAGPRGAVRLARIAVRRLAAPLPYDGAAAARDAVPWRGRPRDPCSLLDPGVVEGAIGPLSGPAQRIDTSGCRYPRPRRGLTEQDVELRFVWQDGVAWLNTSHGEPRDSARRPGPAVIERLESDSIVRDLLGAAGIDASQLHELVDGDTTPLDGPWEAATSAPGEFRFARNGVAVLVIAPTREIARRLAERLAERL